MDLLQEKESPVRNETQEETDKGRTEGQKEDEESFVKEDEVKGSVETAARDVLHSAEQQDTSCAKAEQESIQEELNDQNSREEEERTEEERLVKIQDEDLQNNNDLQFSSMPCAADDFGNKAENPGEEIDGVGRDGEAGRTGGNAPTHLFDLISMVLDILDGSETPDISEMLKLLMDFSEAVVNTPLLSQVLTKLDRLEEKIDWLHSNHNATRQRWKIRRRIKSKKKKRNQEKKDVHQPLPPNAELTWNKSLDPSPSGTQQQQDLEMCTSS